jgi:hypothetical protein
MMLVTADDIAGDLRFDQTGIERVHADAVLLQSGRPRQADYAVLRCYVDADSGVAGPKRRHTRY